MSAHRHHNDLTLSLTGGHATIYSVGGSLDFYGRHDGVASLPTGTYTVGDAPAVGFAITVVTTGSVTLRNSAGTNFALLSTGQAETFVYVASATWFSSSSSLYLQHLATNQGHVDIPLTALREVDADGDVGDISANGGVLASDTTPILEGAGTTNAQRINWATGAVDRVAASVTLPPDFDAARNCIVRAICASGTTNAFNATVVTNWDGGADVTDTISDVAAVSAHASSAVVSAADIPDGPLSVSVSLTPPAHATDAFYLYGLSVRYTRTFINP